jgi:hypothetical protein
MTNNFEGFQSTGREQIQGPTGGAFQDAYHGNWQGSGQVQKGQSNEQQANEQGYLNVPGNTALYNQGGGGSMPQTSEGIPNGSAAAQGQMGANGPEGPNAPGQNNPEGGWQQGGHKCGHHGHHNPLQQLSSELTGANALTSDQTSSIQKIEQQSRQGNQTTEQDLRLQNATLAYDTATGDTSGVTTAEQSIAKDQATLLTNKTAELRSIYGTLTPDQLKQLTTALTNSQQKLLKSSPQPGTPQDLMLQNVNLELAVAGGSNSASDVQTAQQAITSDQGTLLTNMVSKQQTRFSSLQTSNPTEFAQLTSNLKNRVAKLSGNDSTSTAPATTDASMTN